MESEWWLCQTFFVNDVVSRGLGRAITSVLLALGIAPMLAMRWWHPSCDHPDGPDYYAFGFPLPHSEPIPGLSMSVAFSVPLYTFDVVVIAVVIFAIGRGKLPRPKSGWQSILTYGALAAILPVASATSYFTYDLFPRTSITQNGETLSAMRPLFLTDRTRHLDCAL